MTDALAAVLLPARRLAPVVMLALLAGCPAPRDPGSGTCHPRSSSTGGGTGPPPGRPTGPSKAVGPKLDCPARETFPSGGKRIPVERFGPGKPGKHPAVVLLHGVGGLDEAGPLYRAVARRLAGKGFVVLLVHYLERTGTKPKDRPALEKRFRDYLLNPCTPPARVAEVRDAFAAWLEAVADGVKYARAQPCVDPGRVALVGMSLGGFLATAAASRKELKVGCVVELFGGLPREARAGLGHMPPTLIIHGDRDRVVPVKEAYALRDLLLRAKKLPHEIKVYEGVGHGFETEGGKFDALAALDAERRTAAFLAKHLREPPVREGRR